MATSELQSLEEVNYKSRIKFYFYPFIVLFLFTIAFLNFYPVGDKVKGLLKTALQGSACNPDYDKIAVEWIMPKLVISDLTLPPGCLGPGARAPLEFDFINVNFNFISFAPFGLPFKIDTQMNGQPLSFYVVQGFGERMIRLKDQSIDLARLAPLMGGKFKLAGNTVVDLNLLLSNQNAMEDINLKVQSKNLEIPSQSVEGFTIPNLRINDLFIEADSENPPRVEVENFILGDPESPIRANFKGFINLQPEAIMFSQVNLTGEVAFSSDFKDKVPLIEMMFQSFNQKDGFYQVRLGGTLGAIKPSSP